MPVSIFFFFLASNDLSEPREGRHQLLGRQLGDLGRAEGGSGLWLQGGAENTLLRAPLHSGLEDGTGWETLPQLHGHRARGGFIASSSQDSRLGAAAGFLRGCGHGEGDA